MALKDALLAELKTEAKSTKKILEKVPFENPEWKPHEKSMTIGRLATHIAETPHWISDILNANEFDFGATTFSRHTAQSNEELLKIFQEKLDIAIADLEIADDEKLNGKYIMRRGEQVFYELPRKVLIRGFGYNHIFHHRGQLSVYLRLLDIPVPGMYGPSADER